MINSSFLVIAHSLPSSNLEVIAGAANLCISFCYFAISTLLAQGLWDNRKDSVDLLVLVTSGIFFSCGLGHTAHGIGMIGLADTTLWQVCFDGMTMIPAIAFLSLRKKYSLLVRFSQILKSKADLEQRNVTLEGKVEQRTHELQEQNQRLNEALAQANRMQMQLVQSEKMSMLGQMVSGISHEINNPINFIYGNLPHVEEYVQDIVKAVQVYQGCCPSETACEHSEEIDLDFVLEDLPRVVDSMKLGAERIRELVLTLRNFYRLDEAQMKAANLHAGIDSTLVLLNNRHNKKIEIVRYFGDIPNVECHINQLNQVFMNLISNAIEALLDLPIQNKKIEIATHLVGKDKVAVSISDNGCGIPLEVQQHLFEPLFTTKPIGVGTGLGLSICHQIVTETHGGRIVCFSAPTEGTTFVVELPLAQNNPVKAREVAIAL
jgi:signal transduction histidine kinase